MAYENYAPGVVKEALTSGPAGSKPARGRTFIGEKKRTNSVAPHTMRDRRNGPGEAWGAARIFSGVTVLAVCQAFAMSRPTPKHRLRSTARPEPVATYVGDGWGGRAYKLWI